MNRYIHYIIRRTVKDRVSLTKPHVDGIGWSRSGVEQDVGISNVEVAIELLRHWHQIHLFHPPYLQAGLLPCSLELFVGHHDHCKYKPTLMLIEIGYTHFYRNYSYECK